MDKENIKNPLKSYREAQKLTQEGLASLLGVSQSKITHTETGRREVDTDTALDWEEKTNGGIDAALFSPAVRKLRQKQNKETV